MAMDAAVVFPGITRSKRGSATTRWLHRVMSEAAMDTETPGTGVQIVSDGTSEHTQLLLDGQPIRGVTDITWRFSKSKRRATLTVEIRDVAVDMGAEVPADVLAALRTIQQYEAQH